MRSSEGALTPDRQEPAATRPAASVDHAGGGRRDQCHAPWWALLPLAAQGLGFRPKLEPVPSTSHTHTLNAAQCGLAKVNQGSWAANMHEPHCEHPNVHASAQRTHRHDSIKEGGLGPSKGRGSVETHRICYRQSFSNRTGNGVKRVAVLWATLCQPL